MKAGTQHHVKTKRLKRLLKIPLYQAVGILETLWQLCQEVCEEGNIGKFTDDEIADYFEWEGEPSELVRALAAAGWIDADIAERYVIHDWLEECPEYICDRIRKRRQREQRVKNQRGIKTYDQSASDISEDVRADGGTSRDIPGLPNQTQPNHTPPKPIQPFEDDGRMDGFSDVDWRDVESRLRDAGADAWRFAVNVIKDQGCDAAHAMSLVEYGVANGFPPKAIVHRFKIARPGLAADKSWPPLVAPAVAAKQARAAKAESDAAEQVRLKAADEASKARLEREYGALYDAMPEAKVESYLADTQVVLRLFKTQGGKSCQTVRDWVLKQLDKSRAGERVATVPFSENGK